MVDRSKQCSVEGCEREHDARGWCAMHYQRWKKHGTVGGAEKQIAARPEVCTVDGCERPANERGCARGLCVMHFQRLRHEGHPGEAKPRLRRTGVNTKHPLYPRWRHMIMRCTDPASDHYTDWGGRGITVCGRWLGEDGLQNFVADIGLPPGPGYSIDRIDNDGPYSPENCRWATSLEQVRNRRPGLRRVRVDLLLAASVEVGIDETQIRAAIKVAIDRSRKPSRRKGGDDLSQPKAPEHSTSPAAAIPQSRPAAPSSHGLPARPRTRLGLSPADSSQPPTAS